MSTTTATAASRKLKRYPTPPPPSPKILNLPRRTRHLKQSKKTTKRPPSSTSNGLQSYHSLLDLHLQGYYYCNSDRKGKLERLFGEEREFSRSDCSVPIVLLNSSSSPLSLSSGGRRGRVENEVEEGEEEEVGGGGDGGGMVGFVEEKWKFQAEMLRAECIFLRKERELVLKKLEKNKVQMQRTLRSAVETLISGRKKIFAGQNVSAVLEEEIEDLAEKLTELQRNSGIKDFDVRKCSNFDKKAGHLQRRLEKLGGLSDEKRSNELQELAESSLSMSMSHEIDKESCVSGPTNQNKHTDVELLRRKMEGLSKEMWDKLEEDFGSMLSNTASSSVASSASTSKRIECPPETFSTRIYQDTIQQEDGKCSGRCKAILQKIVEQVRAETEQWSQMQGMLGKVREEMEELQASRSFWEDQALNSDSEIKRLQSSVQEWKEKALNYEIKADELQKELSALRGELEKLRTAERNEQSREVIQFQNISPLPLIKQLGKENHAASYHLKENRQYDKECKETSKKNVVTEANSDKDVKPISLGKQLEKEKNLLLLRRKEKHQPNDKNRKQETDCREKSHTGNSTGVVTMKRSPFRDIGNSSPLMKQTSRTVYPLHS